MKWAWQQDLLPTPKLVLMALADAANDQGICWPSISTVATKCRVSDRTVRRVVQTLIARGLMVSNRRFRKDGSCSSNRYQLMLGGGDRLSPPPDTGVRTPCQARQGSPDNGVTPRTTIGTKKETTQLPAAQSTLAISSDRQSSSGVRFELEYPSGLTAVERKEAEARLTGLSAELAQQLLDELSSRMGGRNIRTNPLAYLRGLIKRAHAGTFAPEASPRSTEGRRRRTRAHTDRQEILPISAYLADIPLVRKLQAIEAKRHQQALATKTTKAELAGPRVARLPDKCP